MFWDCIDLHKDERGHISEAEYARMSVKVQRALIATDDFNTTHAREIATTDWDRDTHEVGYMDFEVGPCRHGGNYLTFIQSALEHPTLVAV